uniref:Uncharacterized protein n=1 Tax=Megaselia scalaris TaxID=36166 RepID=T1GVX3_MEGSC
MDTKSDIDSEVEQQNYSLQNNMEPKNMEELTVFITLDFLGSKYAPECSGQIPIDVRPNFIQNR